MKNTNEIKKFEINLSNPLKNKTFQKVLAGVAVVGVVSTATYVFADNYTLNFRSPIIFQNPVVIEKREVYIQPTIENEEFTLEEETHTPEIDEVSYIPSQRGLDCINNNPGLAGKLKEAFGEEWRQASELVCRESSFNNEAINPTSGACGLFQALPCSKMKCELDDVDCQIAWGKDYIENRYKSVDKALAFHDEKGWY